MSSYDPTKSYTWEPDSQFLITGQDLHLVINLLRGMLSTPEASNIILAYEANKNIEKLIDHNIQSGVIKESIKNIQVNSPEEILQNHEEA